MKKYGDDWMNRIFGWMDDKYWMIKTGWMDDWMDKISCRCIKMLWEVRQ